MWKWPEAKVLWDLWGMEGWGGQNNLYVVATAMSRTSNFPRVHLGNKGSTVFKSFGWLVNHTQFWIARGLVCPLLVLRCLKEFGASKFIAVQSIAKQGKREQNNGSVILATYLFLIEIPTIWFSRMAQIKMNALRCFKENKEGEVISLLHRVVFPPSPFERKTQNLSHRLKVVIQKSRDWHSDQYCCLGLKLTGNAKHFLEQGSLKHVIVNETQWHNFNLVECPKLYWLHVDTLMDHVKIFWYIKGPMLHKAI